MSFWQAAEKRGAAAKPIYAVFDPSGLVDWSVDRRNASKIAEETSGGRLAKITPL